MSTHDADLIIVGAGICGSTAATHARALGATVLHLAAEEDPHSLAAVALLRAAWLPDHARPALAATLNSYGPAHTAAGALVTNYRTPRRPPARQHDWHLINPPAPLTAPDLRTTATRAHGRTLHTHDGTYTAAHALLLATGATSPLSPPGTTTWGVTWVGPADALTRPDTLRIHHWAPYKTLAAGPTAGTARVGASSAPTPRDALNKAHDLMRLATDTGLVADPNAFTPHLGARLRTPYTLTRPAPGQYWIGGHHRDGYALGPADARTAVETALGVQK